MPDPLKKTSPSDNLSKVDIKKDHPQKKDGLSEILCFSQWAP